MEERIYQIAEQIVKLHRIAYDVIAGGTMGKIIKDTIHANLDEESGCDRIFGIMGKVA